jgi:hypothetical protein
MGTFPKVPPLIGGQSLFFEKEVVPWGTSPSTIYSSLPIFLGEKNHSANHP